MENPAGRSRFSHWRGLGYGILLTIVVLATTCELKTGLFLDDERGPIREHEGWTWNHVRQELPTVLPRRLLIVLGALTVFEFGFRMGKHDNRDEKPEESEQA